MSAHNVFLRVEHDGINWKLSLHKGMAYKGASAQAEGTGPTFYEALRQLANHPFVKGKGVEIYATRNS